MKKEQNGSRDSKFKNLGNVKSENIGFRTNCAPTTPKSRRTGGRATLPKRKVKFRHTLSFVHAHTNCVVYKCVSVIRQTRFGVCGFVLMNIVLLHV